MTRTKSLVVTAAVLVAMSLAPAAPGVTLEAANAAGSTQAATVQGVVADEFFHVEWAANAASHGRARITGYVYNDWGEYANQVQLRISGLDTAGNVVSSVTQPVADVPAGSRVYFDVPGPRPSWSYRVDVQSYDFAERDKG